MQQYLVSSENGARVARLSYKFQRLREQLREAILQGELNGRLPGERELGRRYGANAKTINKALCDLSSEGLLVRRIGRGTYVAAGSGGGASPNTPRAFACLVPSEESSLPHRQEVFAALQKALADQGHSLETLDPGPQDGPSIRAAACRDRAGLFVYPVDPLAGPSGQLSDAFVAEMFRRHIAGVVIAACPRNAKLNAVIPDYVDAGYRLAEHLCRSGFEALAVVLSHEGGREVELVLAGIQTAAARYGRPFRRTWMPEAGQAGAGLAGLAQDSLEGTGLLCVGGPALRSIRQNARVRGLVFAGKAGLACLLEPGDPAAEAGGVTHYQVPTERLAAWAARLMLEARPAHRPVEVIVPGAVRVHPAPGIRAAGPNPVDLELTGELAEVTV
jgi:DNA-binding LacI/PurR family transcriptional regulator